MHANVLGQRPPQELTAERTLLTYYKYTGELDYRTMYQTSRRVSPPQGLAVDRSEAAIIA